ncbi:hypothetical protein TSAR_008206 [Trichomalopsis sarcophagae]|uniref:Saposin B-type domain-containing protein n=1 Tax=Trichomalopsis sarcophagae TaxID=543379 RepID=A0A232F4T6_9HYME|nr:hypothetical protein TSAR_008206 [Trichomalopsis sarcophagae]
MYKFVVFCLFGLAFVNLNASAGDDRRSQINQTKSYTKMVVEENNLTCDNYLTEYCKSSHPSIYCQIVLKGYLCDNIRDGEAFDQLYDQLKAALLPVVANRTSDEPPIKSSEN